MASKKAGSSKKPFKAGTPLRARKPDLRSSPKKNENGVPRVKIGTPKVGAPDAERANSSSTSGVKVGPEDPQASAPSGGGVDVGDAAPSFVLKDDSGQLVSSESLRGAPYILYFYPKDDTPGCTIQACGFRDSLPRFAAKGVRILGVSPDPPESHARFKKKHGLSFQLLSDPEKTLAKAYGVWVEKRNYGRAYMGVERSTFHVDRRGVVRQVWRGVRVPGHVDAVLHSV